MARLTAEAAALRPRPTDTVRYSTLLAIRTLARRVAYLDDELDELAAVMRPLVERTAPGLLAMYGVGYDVAAKLLVAAGDNPERLRSEAAFAHLCGVAPLEASSGKTRRHRLNRGGDRQANNALYRVVITRMASHPRPGLRRPPPRRGQVDRRDHPHPQALRRPRSLQAPPPHRRHDLTATPDRRRSDPHESANTLTRLFHERTVDRHPHSPPRGP